MAETAVSPDPGLVDALRAPSNPVRLRLLMWPREPERHFPPREAVAGPAEVGVCVSRIQAGAGLAQPTVSAYMAEMQRAGLVRAVGADHVAIQVVGVEPGGSAPPRRRMPADAPPPRARGLRARARPGGRPRCYWTPHCMSANAPTIFSATSAMTTQNTISAGRCSKCLPSFSGGRLATRSAMRSSMGLRWNMLADYRAAPPASPAAVAASAVRAGGARAGQPPRPSRTARARGVASPGASGRVRKNGIWDMKRGRVPRWGWAACTRCGWHT